LGQILGIYQPVHCLAQKLIFWTFPGSELLEEIYSESTSDSYIAAKYCTQP